MKKSFTLISGLLMGLAALANPIPLPKVTISELYFDNAGDWKLELAYTTSVSFKEQGIVLDTIYICSTSDTVMLPTRSYGTVGAEDDEHGRFVLTQDCLDYPFHINQSGDSLTVVIQYNEPLNQEYFYLPKNPFLVKEYLVFGDIPGATVTSPKKGQSICGADGQYYYKDNSPTIEKYNDEYYCYFEDEIITDTLSGIFGTLRGVVYDIRNEPVIDAKFLFYLFHRNEYSYYNKEMYSFSTNGNGQYSVPVLSHKATFEWMDYRVGSKSASVKIDGISFFMEPDSIIDLDIHLPYELATGVQTSSMTNSPVIISPNPVSTGENIRITLDLPTFTSNVWLELIDPSGKSISKTRLQQAENAIEAPSKSGLYIARIVLDGRIITTEKVLVRE